jgi:hypothetical protein
MAKKDIISKEIIKELVIDISKYILKLEIKDLEFIDKELLRVEDRKADVIANVENEYILHLEIQNSNDYEMNYRMLRYFTDIKFQFKTLPVKQYIICTGREKLRMIDNLIDENIKYHYNIIDMTNIDCTYFLNLDTPEALVISILCDFKDKNPDDVILHILKRLKSLTDSNGFRKYVLMLEELSENRDLKENIKKGEKMLTDFDVTKYPSYELGFESGIEQGVEQGIEQTKKEKLILIKNLLNNGVDIKIIALSASMSEEEILNIKENIDEQKIYKLHSK